MAMLKMIFSFVRNPLSNAFILMRFQDMPTQLRSRFTILLIALPTRVLLALYLF